MSWGVDTIFGVFTFHNSIALANGQQPCRDSEIESHASGTLPLLQSCTLDQLNPSRLESDGTVSLPSMDTQIHESTENPNEQHRETHPVKNFGEMYEPQATKSPNIITNDTQMTAAILNDLAQLLLLIDLHESAISVAITVICDFTG